MRYLFGFACVCALGVVPLVGCSETSGNGGTGGDGGGGACVNQEDLPEVCDPQFEDHVDTCAMKTRGSGTATSECLQAEQGVSKDCADCYGDVIDCFVKCESSEQCSDLVSQACVECAAECLDALDECTGTLDCISPTITNVEWEGAPRCMPDERSNVVITVIVSDPDTDHANLTYTGEVTGCSGSVDGAMSTISCPNDAPHTGTVFVSDLGWNESTPVSFDVPVCETGSCTTHPNNCSNTPNNPSDPTRAGAQ